MKSIVLFIAIMATSIFMMDAGAQSRPAPKRNDYGQQQQSNYGNPDTSIKGNNVNNYGSTGNTNTGIDTTLPITVIKGSGNGLTDSTKMSLRNDGAVEKNLVRDRTPLAYEDIREDDAVFMVRVWREIDAREKMNLGFRYSAVEDNGSQRFISILINAIKSGDVTAFNGDDDRFTTPITADDAVNALSGTIGGGNFDTSRVFNDQGDVVGYQVRAKAIDPDSIYKFQLKEEWIFDKESGRLFVRILGIAPVISIKSSTGVELGQRTAWWVYYPDLRPILAKYDVYNPKNLGAEMTWEELFESRMFSSYIVKSTMDNPSDMPLSQVYPNNTLFRLLEGEKIKDKIFNYEQSLWSY